jgi:hypothetical protein
VICIAISPEFLLSGEIRREKTKKYQINPTSAQPLYHGQRQPMRLHISST